MKLVVSLVAFILFLFSFSFVRPVFAVTLLSTGFEDGTTGSWSSSGGGASATISADIVRTGSYSIKIQHDKTSSYGFQNVVQNIEGGMFYQASGYGKTTDANTASFFIRVAWYSSADGSGSQLSSPNDSNIETTINGDWLLLTTNSIQAPASANSAKIRLVLTSKTSGQLAYAYFDDIVFQESIAPTNTPTPTSVPTSTPVPTNTPTPKPTPTPTLIPTPSPTPTIVLPTEVLGESTESAIPTEAQLEIKATESSKQKQKVLGEQVNNTPKILVGIGVIFLITCGILILRKFKMKNAK